jgi:ubiquinone/menaquinone biosynthesis C-methylase UbiE
MSFFSDPSKIVDQCSIQPGGIIADIGAGSGAYAFAFAKALAGTGRVYVIDVQKDLLPRLQAEAQKDHVVNIDVLWGDVEKPGGSMLADGSVDLVSLCNIMFQIEDKKAALTETKRILVPGGRVLIVDWADSFGGIGPHTSQVFTQATALDLFEKNGFAKDRDITAGSHHYGYIFKKL